MCKCVALVSANRIYCAFHLTQYHISHIRRCSTKLCNRIGRIKIENYAEIGLIQILFGIISKTGQGSVYDTHFKHLFKPNLHIKIIVIFKAAAAEHMQ